MRGIRKAALGGVMASVLIGGMSLASAPPAAASVWYTVGINMTYSKCVAMGKFDVAHYGIYYYNCLNVGNTGEDGYMQLLNQSCAARFQPIDGNSPGCNTVFGTYKLEEFS